MAKCKNCKNGAYLKDESGERYHWCFKFEDSFDEEKDERCPHYKPISNADRIRAMTDEELANYNIYFLSESVIKEELRYTGLDGQYYKTGKEVYEANIKWLKSEVGCE